MTRRRIWCNKYGLGTTTSQFNSILPINDGASSSSYYYYYYYYDYHKLTSFFPGKGM